MIWRIPVPAFDWNNRPIITANKRMHGMKRHSIQKKIRTSVANSALSMGIPKQDHVTTWLEYYVTDRRSRDTDNLQPISKPAEDALSPAKLPNKNGKGAAAGAGIVPDDKPRHMEKMQARIITDLNREGPAMYLVVATDDEDIAAARSVHPLPATDTV